MLLFAVALCGAVPSPTARGGDGPRPVRRDTVWYDGPRPVILESDDPRPVRKVYIGGPENRFGT